MIIRERFPRTYVWSSSWFGTREFIVHGLPEEGITTTPRTQFSELMSDLLQQSTCLLIDFYEKLADLSPEKDQGEKLPGKWVSAILFPFGVNMGVVRVLRTEFHCVPSHNFLKQNVTDLKERNAMSERNRELLQTSVNEFHPSLLFPGKSLPVFLCLSLSLCVCVSISLYSYLSHSILCVSPL